MKRAHASATPKPTRGPRRCLANRQHRPHVRGAAPGRRRGRLWATRAIAGPQQGPRAAGAARHRRAGHRPRILGPVTRTTAQNGAATRPEGPKPAAGAGAPRGSAVERRVWGRVRRSRWAHPGPVQRVPWPRPAVPGVLPPRSRPRSRSRRPSVTHRPSGGRSIPTRRHRPAQPRDVARGVGPGARDGVTRGPTLREGTPSSRRLRAEAPPQRRYRGHV